MFCSNWKCQPHDCPKSPDSSGCIIFQPLRVSTNQSRGLTDTGIHGVITLFYGPFLPLYFGTYLNLYPPLSDFLQGFATFGHQSNDHPEHRHSVRANTDAPREGQRQHGNQYDLPEPGSGAHTHRIWLHLWNKRPLLIFSDQRVVGVKLLLGTSSAAFVLLSACWLVWCKMDCTSKDNYGVKKNQDRKLLIMTSGLHIKPC